MKKNIIDIERYKLPNGTYSIKSSRIRELELALEKVKPLGIFFKVIEVEDNLEIISLTDITEEQMKEFWNFDLKGYEGYRAKIEIAIVTAINKKTLSILNTGEKPEYKEQGWQFKNERPFNEEVKQDKVWSKLHRSAEEVKAERRAELLNIIASATAELQSLI